MARRVTVGADLGGTRIRVIARAEPGDWSSRIEARAPALDDLQRFFRTLWRRWRLSRADVDALVVAARGTWTRAERRGLERQLRGLAVRVRAISDAEAAFLGALGNQAGLLVLAGTGAIVLGRNRRGRWARAGGLGPLLGDEGSAFWIGRAWLGASSRSQSVTREMARAPDAVRRIAALAPAVLRRAERGHRTARAVVKNAQALLATLARQVARELRLPRPVRVSWAGSLMERPGFRTGFLRALRRQGIATRAMRPVHPPVAAAQALAQRLARPTRTARNRSPAGSDQEGSSASRRSGRGRPR